MSLFESDAILSDSRTDQTTSEGVRIERRSMLRLSAGTIAAALAAACTAPVRSRSASQESPASMSAKSLSPETLEVGELVAQMVPRARRLIAEGGKREEAYLMGIGELLARLQVPTREDLKATMKRYSLENADDERPREISVVMFKLEPGRGFTHHDHRDYNGVILGVEGEARIKNFDILGAHPIPPSGRSFQLRETRDDLILPDRFSTLGSARDNVHNLVAGPEGATVLDVFTFLRPGARSHWLEVDPTPRDAERKIYDAAWAG